jgi:hypothetical protein
MEAKRIPRTLDDFLPLFHEDVKKIGNTLSVWDAYIIARKAQVSIPDWILEYFDRVARKMLIEENRTEDLAQILGFKWKPELRGGGAGPWKQYRSFHVRNNAIATVKDLLRRFPNLSIDETCKKAARITEERWPESGRQGKKNNKELLKLENLGHFQKQFSVDWP